jgi:hypothetical protein
MKYDGFAWTQAKRRFPCPVRVAKSKAPCPRGRFANACAGQDRGAFELNYQTAR